MPLYLEGLEAELSLSHMACVAWTPRLGFFARDEHVHSSQTCIVKATDNSGVTPDSLTRTLEDFLVLARDAVVIEDGAVLFDLAQSKYSISGEHNKCLIHLWSSERNIVRRVIDAQIKNEVLRLTVQRLGQSEPGKLEICRERDRRAPSVRRAARLAYQRVLHRVLEKSFAGFKVTQLSTSMNLERSFGPIYARGLIKRGQSAFAVLGVSAEETQASIDSALTFGILWLDLCRQTHAGKLVVEGLKLFVPTGCSALSGERIAHLDGAIAKWQLYELEEKEHSVREIDVCDYGNIDTHLLHSLDFHAAMQRFSNAVATVHALMPEVEVAVLSPAEIAFRGKGLEFAKARLAHDRASLNSATEIVFGLGASERILNVANFQAFEQLVRSIGEMRHLDGPRDHPLWRMHPERWLEALVGKEICAIDDCLDPTCVYSQVPAFSGLDRGMIDVLTVTRENRLAVLELKADEDIHLPLQGLDYWSRVAWHHQRGEFQKLGYFSNKELSPQKPMLLLVAPTLHIHPATDTLLRYLSPEIDWTLVAIGERWRENLEVIFRKRRKRPLPGTLVA